MATDVNYEIPALVNTWGRNLTQMHLLEKTARGILPIQHHLSLQTVAVVGRPVCSEFPAVKDQRSLFALETSCSMCMYTWKCVYANLHVYQRTDLPRLGCSKRVPAFALLQRAPWSRTACTNTLCRVGATRSSHPLLPLCALTVLCFAEKDTLFPSAWFTSASNWCYTFYLAVCVSCETFGEYLRHYKSV